MAYKQHMAELEDQQNAGKEPEGIGDGQRWGTREIEITHVELCNAGGQPRTTFNTGDLLTIRLHFRCAGSIEHPVFGFGISHQSGVHLFGPNTKFAALEIDHVSGTGSISYTIPELPLLEGQYTLSAAVVNETDTVTYDYHDRAYNFRVAYSPQAAGYGMVQLHGPWQVESKTEHSRTIARPLSGSNSDVTHSNGTKA
jgi:lipopolysaccharide transport system ATP-binding protein